MNDRVKDPEFAKRVSKALHSHPDVPERSYGTIAWLAREIQNGSGIKLTMESVRRWVAGESVPRRENLRALATALRVDAGWLAVGATKVRPEPQAAPMLQSRRAEVIFAAGALMLEGIPVSFGDQNGADISVIEDHELKNYAVALVSKMRAAVVLVPGRGIIAIEAGAQPRMHRIEADELPSAISERAGMVAVEFRRGEDGALSVSAPDLIAS